MKSFQIKYIFIFTKLFLVINFANLLAQSSDSTSTDSTQTEIQEAPVSWKRAPKVTPPLQLFHSIHGINFPTAETLQAGDFFFGLSHRFNEPIAEGFKELWGLDGSVTMRIELGYAPTNDMIVIFGRTNKDLNYDLQIKHSLYDYRNDFLPVKISANIAGSYTNRPFNSGTPDNRKYHYFANLLINTMYDNQFAFGLIPTYLYNSNCGCQEVQHSITMGIQAQYYMTEMYSFMIEYNPTIEGYRNSQNSITGAFIMETGGHFFKFLITNNPFSNQVQYLSGAAGKWNINSLHFGFQITRNF